jgi:PmbA protein
MTQKLSNTLIDLAEDVIARALKHGATAADAVAADDRSTEVSINHGKIEKLEQSEAREVSLRVFFGQSSASISGSALDNDALDRLVERVCAMAKLAPPDPYAGIAEKELLSTQVMDFDQVSSDFPDAQDLRKLAEETEAIALAVPGITRSNGAGTSTSDYTGAFATSNGFRRVQRYTGFGIGVSVVAGEGTAMERDYDGHGAAHFSDLESAEKIARNAATRAVKRLNPRKVSSQSVPLIFDRRVATSFMGHAISAINGAAIARGTSFLKDDLGKQIFGNHVTIIDDPHRMRSSSSRAADGEGLPTKKRALFDKGIPHNWILDLKSARQLKLAPTGQGSRGGPTSFNIHMEAGTQSPEDIIKLVKQGLFVTEFIGSSINMVTGDYSRGCSGYWIENGELAYPVSEVTIAGNLRDMFAKLTPANDLIFRSSSNAPSVMIEGMTIAGK